MGEVPLPPHRSLETKVVLAQRGGGVPQPAAQVGPIDRVVGEAQVHRAGVDLLRLPLQRGDRLVDEIPEHFHLLRDALSGLGTFIG